MELFFLQQQMCFGNLPAAQRVRYKKIHAIVQEEAWVDGILSIHPVPCKSKSNGASIGY